MNQENNVEQFNKKLQKRIYEIEWENYREQAYGISWVSLPEDLKEHIKSAFVAGFESSTVRINKFIDILGAGPRFYFTNLIKDQKNAPGKK